MMLYLYLDDIREFNFHLSPNFPNERYLATVKSVNDAKYYVNNAIENGVREIWFDLDHDLGDYASQGGDAIKLIDWLVEEFHDKNVIFKFRFHSMNPVGVQNMKNAVEKYWEVF